MGTFSYFVVEGPLFLGLGVLSVNLTPFSHSRSQGMAGSLFVLPENGNVIIHRLGNPKVASPLFSAQDDAFVRLMIDNELEASFAEPRELCFEKAGARKALYFDPSKGKAAIVTCGGLCPGINDVIRSIVRTLHREYHAASVLGIRYGLRGFIPKYRLDVQELTIQTVASIHEAGGTYLGTSRGPQPATEVIDALERLNINMLFIIGGDGTMKAAREIDALLQARGSRIAVIGIPKTIDNDINFIPRSFGFETAVDKTVEALRCARTEAMSVPGGIGIVKIMGRESGFIAAHAALAYRDVDFVLVPEVPFELHGERGLLEALEARLAAQGHALIAVAEGAGQNFLPVQEGSDASGNKDLADISSFLMRTFADYFIEHNISYYFKFIDPSYMVRSVPAGSNDRIYAATLAQHAVHAAMSGRTGMVVAEIMDHFVHLPLALVTEKRRKLNPKSSLWRSVLACTGQGQFTASDQKNPEAESAAGNSKGSHNERITCRAG